MAGKFLAHPVISGDFMAGNFMDRDFLAGDFLAHPVIFRDLMVGNFLAGDFLGGYHHSEYDRSWHRAIMTRMKMGKFEEVLFNRCWTCFSYQLMQ